jgi:hypothetical protein
MHYQEMLTLLFALVLFTSIAMIANNNLLTQAEFLHDSFYQLQAIQIAQRYLDRIDERLYADAIRLSGISSLYDGENVFHSSRDKIDYVVTIASAYTDSLGNATGSVTGYYRVDILISTRPEVINPVQISRLYAAF